MKTISDMSPDVTRVKPESDYTVHVWFENGEEGILDMKPYLEKGIFKALREPAMFHTVRPFMGTIQWANEADLCPDTVYLDSVKITNTPKKIRAHSRHSMALT